MLTSETSPEPNSNPLTSSAVASPAKIYHRPESGPELRALAAAFGLSSPVLLGNFDRRTYLLKTSQACLFPTGTEDESTPLEYPEYLESWPDSGMWDSGGVYELQSSAPVTSESGSLSLPTWNTPSTEDHKTDGPKALGRYGTEEMRTCDMRLRNQAMWPTARQEDGESCGNHPGAVDSLTGASRNWVTPKSATGGPDLMEQVQHWKTPHGMGNEDFRGKKGGAGGGEFALQANNWQTPAVDSFRSRGGDRKDEMELDQQARMFPTPASRDYRTPNLKPGSERGMGTKGEQLQNFVEHRCPSPPAPATPDGPPSSEIILGSPPPSKRRLNVEFVTWLMGFPAWWVHPD